MSIVVAGDPSLSRIHGVLVRDGVPFTGQLIERAAAGPAVSATEYRAGLRDGIAEAWYPNGQLQYHREYRRGREEGEHTGWWADGHRHFVYHYHEGLIGGVAREWFPNGRIYREYHYDAGHESGSEKMWYPDGTLRTNYVMRNGRRFGLPGTKGCTGLDTTMVIP